MVKFESPKITVDIIIFTIFNDVLQVLFVKRKKPPFKDSWAFPGGFLEKNEPLIKAAKRELFEEAGVKNIYLEQLYTFGDPGRDPRGRVVTVAYFALAPMPLSISAGSDAKEARWWPVNRLSDLAFDHKEILEYALKRLQMKLEYTNVVWALLPDKFTLFDLQRVYEIIWNKKIDKRNFRKKILSLKLLKPLREMRTGFHQRPAQLFSFRSKRKIELRRFF